MYEGLIGPSYMDFSKKQTFVTTGILNVHKSSILRIQSIQILFDSLDEFAAVQHNGCLQRSDKRKIFCHLTFFNGGESCFLQIVGKPAKAAVPVQFTAFSKKSEAKRSLGRQ